MEALGIFLETYRHLQRAKSPAESLSDLKTSWAQKVLSRLGAEVTLQGRPTAGEAVLFVGNHISYLDIPLLMSVAGNISFVAKHELSRWPLFGEAAKKAETIFVKRESGLSRKNTRATIHKALREGKRIALFPSGTTCLREDKPWRRGAFEIACEENVWVQPFRISYTPLRTVAYIDNDFFPVHLVKLFRAGHLRADIEFHEPVKIVNPEQDALYWQSWTQARRFSS